jgi:hypothetical protein
MTERIEFKAYFWLPGFEDDKVPGLLTFEPEDSTKVELIGQFKNYQNPSSIENNLVLGTTSTGKELTLLNCYETSRTMGFPGFGVATFSAMYLFIGAHFKSLDEIVFDSAHLEYEDLNFWLDAEGFDIPIHDKDQKRTTFSYKQPDRILLPISDHWHAEIEFGYHQSMPFFRPISNATIEQVPTIGFFPNQPTAFKLFQDIYSTFNSLLAVSYFGYPVIKSISFYIPNPDENIHEEEPKQIEVSLHFGTDNSTVKHKARKIEYDFLIAYKDVNFAALVKAFYELNTKIEATIDILTESLMRRGGMVTEFKFLGFTQALESMHRELTGNDVHLKSRLDELVAELPVNVRDALLYNESILQLELKNIEITIRTTGTRKAIEKHH